LRLYLNFSFANFFTACAIAFVQRLCDWICRSHLLGRPCAGFRTRCREIVVAGGAGTPLARLRFPSALVVASRACVSRLPARDTAVPLRHFARPRAFFAGPGNTMVVGERCPCGFRTLHGSCGCPRSPRSVGRDRDLVLSRVSGDFCGSTSLVWLAIRTSGSYLNETNVWLEHSRRNRPSVRAIQRTVAQFRVIRLGRLFARRTATRDYGRRATWPIVWLIVSA
jgi:hypothetical protein